MNQITKITIDGNFDQVLKSDTTIDLGITSPKTALLLNYLFNKAEEVRPSHEKWSRRYGNTTVKVGGGLLVKAEARVLIDDLDRVKVGFSSEYKVNDYVRVAKGKAEVQKSIKDKIANELKKIWKKCSVNDKISILYRNPHNIYGVYGTLTTSTYSKPEYLDLKGVQVVKTDRSYPDREFVEISLNEYRTVYEFLKGRSPEKVKERNGVTAWNSMIGKPVEDQFLIGAIETIQAEIKKAKEEYSLHFNEAAKERDDAKSLADKIFREKTDNFEKDKNAKIADLKNQMNEMIKMANAVSFNPVGV